MHNFFSIKTYKFSGVFLIPPTGYLLQNGANYNLPIFHRYDYSIPIENSVPGDKGKPMFLMDVLKEDESDFYTDEYKYKTLIIDFLKEQGVK